MKSYLMPAAVLATVSISSVGHADVIKCVFTEPFVSSTYSMTQSTLTYSSDPTGAKSVLKNVSFQIKGAGQFELVSASGKVLQTLTLDNQGSDGMSDRVFPYSVKDTSMDKNANNGYGGCTSNSLKATDVNE